jgi:hypothetical protein
MGSDNVRPTARLIDVRAANPVGTSAGTRPAWLSALVVFNALLLIALLLVSVGPLRAALGEATGVWHDCEIRTPGGSGTDGWNWPLLLALVPFLAGIVLGAWSHGTFDTPFDSRTPARGSALLATVSIIGVALTLVMWFVPTSYCIA